MLRVFILLLTLTEVKSWETKTNTLFFSSNWFAFLETFLFKKYTKQNYVVGVPEKSSHNTILSLKNHTE